MFAFAPPRLRAFRPSDAAQCARLLEDGWREALPRRAPGVTLDAFAALTEGEEILVAAQGPARVVGFVAFDRPHSFVHHLYVDARRRRRGVGAALLAAAVAECPARASLKCAVSNLPALEFYHALGWTWGERGFDADGAWIRLLAP